MDQLLEIGSGPAANWQCPTQSKWIQECWTSGTIKARDGIEVGIEARDDRASGVGFEALQADLLYVHYLGMKLKP